MGEHRVKTDLGVLGRIQMHFNRNAGYLEQPLTTGMQ